MVSLETGVQEKKIYAKKAGNLPAFLKLILMIIIIMMIVIMVVIIVMVPVSVAVMMPVVAVSFHITVFGASGKYKTE